MKPRQAGSLHSLNDRSQWCSLEQSGQSTLMISIREFSKLYSIKDFFLSFYVKNILHGARETFKYYYVQNFVFVLPVSVHPSCTLALQHQCLYMITFSFLWESCTIQCPNQKLAETNYTHNELQGTASLSFLNCQAVFLHPKLNK